MNSEICFDACRNIYGKSSSTFWGIFIKIPKLIPRVATLGHKFVKNRHLEKIVNKTQLNVICPSAKMFVHSSEIN